MPDFAAKGEWAPEQAVLPYAEINGGIATIHSIRNFEYRSARDFTPRYYDRTIPIADVVSVDFIVVPFTKWLGIAHTFVSFGIKDGTYLAVSVEARRQVGQRYSPLKGLFGVYGLIYVIADERDVIYLRTNIWKSNAYLYPIRATPQKVQRLFVEMLLRANKLKELPERYNSLTNSCTVNLVRHINTVTPKRVPLSIRMMLSWSTDTLAYTLGLIDSPRPLKEIRDAHRITGRALRAGYAADFSNKIRGR